MECQREQTERELCNVNRRCWRLTFAQVLFKEFFIHNKKENEPKFDFGSCTQSPHDVFVCFCFLNMQDDCFRVRLFPLILVK